LEIGAGTGNLTAVLAKAGAKVTAVELDGGLAKELKKRFARSWGVDVVEGNGLKLLKKANAGKIVANIPYAICEPLIQSLKAVDFELAVLTVPKGFAENITSDGTKLGLECGIFFEIDVLFDVPAAAFEPEPDVISSVVSIKPRKSLLRETLLQPHAKLKNAAMEALVSARKCTKNEAREAIKAMNLSTIVAEKRVKDMDLNDLRQLVTRFKDP
jgi:16S rRNA A1518/A1519 N6-dimethyltransferase RsmA/KsgA/DIM1 with predicted DNA glycosylase/AP lyase activity